MRAFTVADAVAATGGRYYGDEAGLKRAVRNVTSDSRTADVGSLFVCYRGARVDGHDFMADCLKRGAACCLSEREPANDAETPCIVVDSTLGGVAKLAGWYRNLFDVPVVGVTGSVGKTTAKEMIWAVLNRRFRTHKNRMNFNNEISLPLMILEMPEDAQTAVLEMGISGFGEMTRLAGMVRPNLAVITNIGDAHLEFLHDRKGVLRAKTEVFDCMPRDGLAILNGDDQLLRSYDAPVKKLTFGLNEGNDFRAVEVENLAEAGTRMRICHHGRSFPVQVPAFGTHLAYAVLAGAAVGWALGMTDAEIAEGISRYRTVGDRARVLKTERWTVISDCYNANPSSTAAAIDSLKMLPGRCVCILGDMLELGENTAALHAQVGGHAAQSGVDLVLAVGALSRNTYEGALAAGGKAIWFETKAALIDRLSELLQPGDSVLVKASHSMAFEEITQKLLEM